MRLHAPLAAALLALAAAGAAGQPELSDQTFTRPTVGLTASLPVGATMSSYEIAGRGANRIILPGNTALVNVSEVILTKAQTLREVADTIINQRLASVSSLRVDPNLPGQNTLEDARGRVLERENRTIGGWPCEVFYIQVAGFGGEDSAFGYALFMPTGNAVAMLELQTTAPSLAEAKPYFELIVDSAVIADPGLADSERAVGVEAGISLFRSLSPADYEAAIDRIGEEWSFERLFRSGADGSDREATELGYRRTRAMTGRRQDLKTGAEQGRVTPEDRQSGYLVFQEARLLDADRNVIIDFAAGFFMTPDRQSEAWSIRQTVKPWKGAGATSHMVETGVRDRNEMTIARSQNGKPVNSLRPAIEGTGYISRVETYLLPHLLMAKAAAGTYRCYAFNQAADRVTLREDVLESDAEHAGAWKHRSRPGESSQPQTTFYTSGGELVRSELPQDQLWEPVTLDRLVSLWSSKGLPTQ